ncbi:MAG: histidine kinase [Deltaproteobacteria bacterium]|nr:histidine kinase [Deltaproteobacteria bacterium]
MNRWTKKELVDELDDLRFRLEEAEDTLRAIRQGEVDALVVSGPDGDRIYTLKGADYSYRVLVETINEGAATLDRNGKIIYANRSLSELLKSPLQKVVGSSIRDYILPFDRASFESLLVQAQQGNSKGEVHLIIEGVITPVLFSLSSIPLADLPGAVGLVVTDLSQQKRQEKLLRYLTEQLIKAQENERRRLAAELHDELGHALLNLKLSIKSLEKNLAPEQGALKEALSKIIQNIGNAFQDVRRLYQHLSPGDLEDLGLTIALHNLVEEFADIHKNIIWTVKLDNLNGFFDIPQATVIYRIIQEALTNIGKHAQAKHASIVAERKDQGIAVTIKDDGMGFDPSDVGPGKNNLGLLAMEERVKILGGAFKLRSEKNHGTSITFLVPFSPLGEVKDETL